MMNQNLISTLLTRKDRQEFRDYITLLLDKEKKFFLRNQILLVFHEYCDANNKKKRFREKSSLFYFLKQIQELFVCDGHIVVVHRHDIAKYRFYLLRPDGAYMEAIDCSRYLELKDGHVLGNRPWLFVRNQRKARTMPRRSGSGQQRQVDIPKGPW